VRVVEHLDCKFEILMSEGKALYQTSATVRGCSRVPVSIIVTAMVDLKKAINIAADNYSCAAVVAVVVPADLWWPEQVFAKTHGRKNYADA
jgi:hypothetical protein